MSEIAAITVKDLRKSYGKHEVLKGVSFQVETGSIYALLGPNGAGKTTVVRTLATLLGVQGGQAEIYGYDVQRQPKQVRSKISLTGQFAAVDEELTGQENLALIGRLLGFKPGRAKQRAAELLKVFDLVDAANLPASKYSGGMRRRLDIAASIVATPQLIFLDEPTTGLDPRSRNQVWEIIRALAADGTTIVLTTQYLEEADQLADYIGIIDDGKLIAKGTPNELKASVGEAALQITLEHETEMSKSLQLCKKVLGTESHGNEKQKTITANIKSDISKAGELLTALATNNVTVKRFSLSQPSLDEVFLALTGHAAKSKQATTETEEKNAYVKK